MEAMQKRPADVATFAATYFAALAGDRRRPTLIVDEAPGAGDAGDGDAPGAVATDDEGYLPEGFLPPGFQARCEQRRSSVFGGSYAPTGDAAAAAVVHPKSDAERRELLVAVKGLLLFRTLAADVLSRVVDAMFRRETAAGEVVIKQGDDGDNFYVIKTGVYDIEVRGDAGEVTFTGDYDHTGSFGELALMYNQPRAATITSRGQGILWCLDRATFKRSVVQNAGKAYALREKMLASAPILATLSNFERVRLSEALERVSFADKACIIKQGDPGETMYFIEKGAARVMVRAEGGQEELQVSTLEAGAYFGELALIMNRPRAASVYAVGSVALAALDIEAFERLLGPCVDVMKRNMATYEEQLVRLLGAKPGGHLGLQ